MTAVTVAGYLFKRLRQCGILSIFGVPGDYNLKLLDHVEPNGLEWIGNCNELNAGYAADAYSRINGIGALITTYGVGELSALNAIAGAYAEKAPVVHIVGSPARKSQHQKAFLHHTIGDGQYNHFAQMYEHITVAQADLQDPRNCRSQIDFMIQQCQLHHQPVYIALPEDMVDVLIDDEGLSMPLPSLERLYSGIEEKLLCEILARIDLCKRPAILVDGESSIFGFTPELNKLAGCTGWPTFTTPFGKSIINESLQNFYGLWKRDVAPEDHLEYAKKCDLVLCFGPHWSDTNTYGFSSIPDLDISLCFGSSTMIIGHEKHYDISVKLILELLLNKLEGGSISWKKNLPTLSKPLSSITLQPNLPVTQSHFYSQFSKLFKSDDIILAETGTAGHGSRDFKLPYGSVLLNPVTWLSIGYMLPAALGASLARRDRLSNIQDEEKHIQPRTILFIGDGSFQMSAQELSTILRHKINFMLVLINNDGYTIERCIHGKDKVYNDIASWDYLMASEFFGASRLASTDYQVRTASVKTWEDLNLFLKNEKSSQRTCFSMIEVIMAKEDAPKSLLNLLDEQYKPN